MGGKVTCPLFSEVSISIAAICLANCGEHVIVVVEVKHIVEIEFGG